jgi:hypothetical protein
MIEAMLNLMGRMRLRIVLTKPSPPWKEGAMNKELLDKLMEYIDDRIDEKLARQSSDGGFTESMWCAAIKEELESLAAVKGGSDE